MRCPKCSLTFIYGEEKQKSGRYGSYYILPCSCKISNKEFYKLKVINGVI